MMINNNKRGSTFIDATFGIIITTLIVMLLYKSNIFTKKHEVKNIEDLNSNIELSNIVDYLYSQKSWENIENIDNLTFNNDYLNGEYSFSYIGENEYGLDVIEVCNKNQEEKIILEKFNY